MIIHQIYYDDKSKSNCLIDDRVKLYKNTLEPKPYYENSIISKLIPEETNNRVGVFSHKYTNKIGISLDKIEARKEDIVSFFALNYKNHYWSKFEQWHPNGLKAMNHLKDVFGWRLNFKKQPKHIIYQNHFVANTDIYKDYVSNYLNPVMNYLNTNDYLVNYKPKILRYQGDTMHTFLCERLFTVYLEENDFNVYQFNKLYD